MEEREGRQIPSVAGRAFVSVSQVRQEQALQ